MVVHFDLKAKPGEIPSNIDAKQDAEARQELPAFSWHSRSLALIQSSGTGKSRLVHELNGLLCDDGDAGALHLTFPLCFREENEAAFPMGDWEVLVWLREDMAQYVPSACAQISLPELYRMRWIAFLRSIYRASATIIERCPGDTPNELREYWLEQCRSSVDALSEQRQEGHHNVHLYSLAKTEAEECWLEAVEDVTARSANYDSNSHLFAKDQLKNLVEDAAKLRSLLDDFLPRKRWNVKVWFHICLDEVANIRPAHLKQTKSDFSWLEQVRSMYCPDPRHQMPPLFWIIMLGTNAGFAALSPAQKDATSGRVASGKLVQFPPYLLTISDLWLRRPSSQRTGVFRATPYQATRPHVLALWGRPLWQSLVGYQDQNPILGDADLTFLGGQQLTFVLQKLRNQAVSSPSVVGLKLTSTHYLALLGQRLVLDGGHDFAESIVYCRHPCISEDDQKQMVDEHLRMLRNINRTGDAVATFVMSEPLVSHMAATELRHLAKGRIDYDAGLYGEITAQAIFAVCKDAAPRPSANQLGLATMPEPYDPAFHFVQLRSFLETTFNADDMSKRSDWAMLLDSAQGAWVNFTRFTRHDKTLLAITPRILRLAWLGMKAIVGAPNQYHWDLIIPIYCGSLHKRVDHNAFTFIEIQVKAHKISCNQPQPPLPESMARQWAKPPISTLMNVGTTGNGEEKVEVSSHKKGKHSTDGQGQNTWFEISTKRFQRSHHPGLGILMPGQYAGVAHEDFVIARHPSLTDWPEYQESLRALEDREDCLRKAAEEDEPSEQ
ncbi:hypothetical protein IE81DRAFT_345205 [Ceraceosorus guamensis]|uniref:Uncharacterized protein n=1 Tax=Ceraceosorus guamensis TaxID=1522189 RepID=A0A316W7V8_9BASI|nr:hypothetical protein IE81DRAFT_345205 [Ceraceosorus guamensis]PWN44811.1 hypothetical protein IE81DRAFT_345205 [Ceraceosorus guamensis]